MRHLRIFIWKIGSGDFPFQRFLDNYDQGSKNLSSSPFLDSSTIVWTSSKRRRVTWAMMRLSFETASFGLSLDKFAAVTRF